MDLWKHRKYLDLWSLVHLLSGMLIGAGCFYLGLGFNTALLFAVSLLTGWEILEWLTGISETVGNIVLDLVIGIAGFLAALYWYQTMHMPFNPNAIGAMALITALLALWGFLDMKFYGYR